MQGQIDITGDAKGGGSKRGVVYALIALVLVVAGAAFAYSFLTKSGAAPSETDNAAAAMGEAAQESSGEASNREAIYLKDYNSTVYTEQDIPLLLTEIADGKPLVVNFWATWCPYCIQEMDDFQQIFDEYGERVSFAFIDCVDGQRETVESGATWMREQGYTLPAYFDTDYDAVRDYGASSLPTTVVAGADGEILTVSVGAINPEKMRAALDAAGLPYEKQAFRPHITLCRKTALPGEFRVSLSEQGLRTTPMRVQAATLFCSALSGEGPSYTPLHTERAKR